VTPPSVQRRLDESFPKEVNPYWESLYLQLGQLVSEMPHLSTAAITPEMNRWLGRAAHLVKVVCGLADSAIFDIASNNLSEPVVREMNAQTISATVYRALATAESNAPTAARGGFIGVGAALDAMQVVGRVLAKATQDALIVDAYMGSKVFTDFAPTAPQGVSVRLLTDSFYTKPEALRPGMTRWKQQFGGARPLEVRSSKPRALHDRLIVADGTLVWSLTQSLEHIADRSPALVQQVDFDLAEKKREFYEKLWTDATPLD